MQAKIEDLQNRVNARMTVVKAVMRLAARGKSEAEAYAQLRHMAMAWRISFEEAAERIVGPDASDERDAQ